MSEPGDLPVHHFEFVNDEFRVAIDATCPDWTWHGIVGDVTERLSKPAAVITFPDKLSAEEAESLRAKFARRWTA